MKGEEEGEAEEEGLPSGATTGEPDLRRVAAHVDSLISSSYSVKLFPGKWHSLRNKLALLSSGLTSAAPSSSSDDDPNSPLPGLLRAITATVEQARGLALCCSGESPYPGGKLLMRSDLDLAASRLDLHAGSLAGAYASGVLIHAMAVVVPRPGAGATREDVRFYVRDLFSRMEVGVPAEMRSRALSAFHQLFRDGEKGAGAALAESPEAAVALLVGFLDSGDGADWEEAAGAVSLVAGLESHRPWLVRAGAVAALVRVLESGTGLGKERAAGALRRLTENSDNAWSVSAHGGVGALLELCRGGGEGELVGSACRVLRNLAGVGEVRRYMVEQGVVEVFVELSTSSSSSEELQVLAMELLLVIAADDPEGKARVVREGGVESLVRALHPSSSSNSSKVRETALRAIEAICFSPTSSVNALIAAGFLDRVVFFLRHGDASLQGSALKAASGFSMISDESRRAMGDAGLAPELLRLLEVVKSSEVRETAAAALARMVSEQRNRRRFVRDEHGVRLVLRLVLPGTEKTAATKSLLSILTAVSESGSGRRRIAGCHYVEHLQKLAEADVADAKRIIKKLSCNRLINMLSGIWSSS